MQIVKVSNKAPKKVRLEERSKKSHGEKEVAKLISNKQLVESMNKYLPGIPEKKLAKTKTTSRNLKIKQQHQPQKMSMKTMIYAAASPATPTPLIEPSVVIKPQVNYQLSASSNEGDYDDGPDEVRLEAEEILQKVGQYLVDRVKEEEQAIK